MLRPLSSKAQGCKYFWKPSKPCNVGIHWTALVEYSRMSTHKPGFQSFLSFLHHFVLAKLAISSIRVNTSLSKNYETGFPKWAIIKLRVFYIQISLPGRERSWMTLNVAIFQLLADIFYLITRLRAICTNYSWTPPFVSDKLFFPFLKNTICRTVVGFFSILFTEIDIRYLLYYWK